MCRSSSSSCPILLVPALSARCRNRVIRRREGQFRIVNTKVAALEVEQTARPAEIVQQMTIDMEQIGAFTDMRNNVLVPDFGEQRTAGFFHWPILPWPFIADNFRRRPPFLYGLLFQASACPYQSTAGCRSARARAKITPNRTQRPLEVSAKLYLSGAGSQFP